MNAYKLTDKGEPILCGDILEWAAWFETTPDRVVEQTTIGGLFVSTVFLGFDHVFLGGPPLLWETMLFADGGVDQWCERTSTREQALAAHRRACEFAGRVGS